MQVSSNSIGAFGEHFRTLDLFARIELILSAALGLGLAVSVPWTMTESGATNHWDQFAVRILALVISGNFAHNFVFYWQIRRIPEFYSWVQEYRDKRWAQMPYRETRRVS